MTNGKIVDKILIVHANEGKLLESKIIEGNLEDIVKEFAKKVLEKWDPLTSDFVIVRDKYEASVKLPLTKEQYKILSRFNLRRTGEGMASFDIPIYVISYENVWLGDDYLDKKIYLISVYVNEEIRKELENWAVEATKEKPSTTIELSEEELRELEEEEE